MFYSEKPRVHFAVRINLGTRSRLTESDSSSPCGDIYSSSCLLDKGISLIFIHLSTEVISDYL